MARGLLREGRARLEHLLDHAGIDDVTRAETLAAAGFLAFQQGDLQDAEALAAESLALYRRLGDPVGAADALLNLGRAALQQARFAEAEGYLCESLALARGEGTQIGAADALRERLGAPALGPDCESLERWMATVRAGAQGAFAEAWREGAHSPEAQIEGVRRQR
jgi:tetratricopeptide (TPR) repeat protein